MKTLAEALSEEIERVSAKRERWRGYAESGGGLSFAPGISLMTATINAAHRAIGSGDIAAMCRAHEDLRGFSDND